MRLVVFIILNYGFFSFQISSADDSHQSTDSRQSSQSINQDNVEYSPGVAPIKNKLYEEECGACHTLYPAGFLPAKSWLNIMRHLDAHFGGNAELDKETADKIVAYLQKNSADNSHYPYSVSVMQSIATGVEIERIIKVPFIIQKHAKISPLLIAAKVGSLSNCEGCHRKSTQGFFSEKDTRIPGFDKFD